MDVLFRSRWLRERLQLWYDAPATVWEEALPLGNGRIGAMVYGNPLHEIYQLNEETLWSGYSQDCDNPKAAEVLPSVREAVNQGDYVRASALWKQMRRALIRLVTCQWRT